MMKTINEELCECPKCGYEGYMKEFRKQKLAEGKEPNEGGLSIYLIGEKDEEGGSSEETNS